VTINYEVKDALTNGGKVVVPEVTVTANTKSGKVTLVEGTDYELNGLSTEAGTGYVEIISKDTSYYTFDKVTASFTITADPNAKPDDEQKPDDGSQGGETETPVITGTNIAVKNNEVTVVLKSATIKGTGSKVVKPTVYVYTAEGKKLSSKLYHVDYDQTASLGKKTLTVTLDTTAYTFKDGANKASASYEVVDKSAGLTLTASAKAVTYGNLPEITGTVKQGSKTVSKTVNYSLKDLMDANGNIPAGIYSVAVSATVDGTTVSTQVLVTVKAQKATLKSVKLDSVAQADVKNLDKATLETEIENKIVANSKGTLSTGEVTVTINNWSDVTAATKTVKVKYTVKLNNSNKTFTSGKFVTSKDASVSLKVTTK
jgi:hypothetical protein